MWFSGHFRHQVLLKSDVEEEILPPWAIQQKPQETLDEHVARPVEEKCIHSFRLPATTRHLRSSEGLLYRRRYRKCE
jgi:hypothetical protein